MQVKVDISLFIVLKSPCLYFCDLNAILYFMNQKKVTVPLNDPVSTTLCLFCVSYPSWNCYCE